MRVADTKVHDINLIYFRVIGLQASYREIYIYHIINHVLALLPTAVFTEPGGLRAGKTCFTIHRVLHQECGKVRSTIQCLKGKKMTVDVSL